MIFFVRVDGIWSKSYYKNIHWLKAFALFTFDILLENATIIINSSFPYLEEVILMFPTPLKGIKVPMILKYLKINLTHYS